MDTQTLPKNEKGVLPPESAEQVVDRDEAHNDERTALVLSTVRCLAADLVQNHKGGHPGTALGAAALGVALWKEAMTYDPRAPLWSNRDRFVLSAGHACLFQYIPLHLVGYEGWPLEELKRYHTMCTDSKAAGHPEIEPDHGIEVTTGPLGQGIANAVGMAMASKHFAATYNRPGLEIVSNRILCMTGDGCIQEGVGMEAVSLAGHLGLDNLILIYDDNRVTVDGSIANCFTDDTPAKFAAQHWRVFEIPAEQGTHDVAAIAKVLRQARSTGDGRPTLVVVRTTIGFGSRKANTGPVHGQPLGDEEVAYVKSAFGMDPKERFVVSDEVYRYFASVREKGAKARREWEQLARKYEQQHPEQWKELQRRLRRGGRLPSGWRDLLPAKADLLAAAQPTRKSSGIVVEALVPRFDDFMVGSADLLESTFVSWKGMTEFQAPSTGLGDYAGRQIRYGIREHAMLAICNGMSAYERGAIIPVCSTFSMFYLYAAPAIRMAALQKLRFIGVATHDSIGIGEDGPTHQPVALAHLFRAMPNVHLIRPADAEEVMGAWSLALDSPQTPSIICFSRQPVALQPGSDRAQVERGAYTIWSSARSASQTQELVLIATGSEVGVTVEAAERLAASTSLPTRVVSMPIMSLFDQQTEAYRRQVLPTSGKALIIAIEAWNSFGWARYAHASLSMHTFGLSGPQADLFEHFGFGLDNIVSVIEGYVARLRTKEGLRIPGVGEFEELLLERQLHKQAEVHGQGAHVTGVNGSAV